MTLALTTTARFTEASAEFEQPDGKELGFARRHLLSLSPRLKLPLAVAPVAPVAPAASTSAQHVCNRTLDLQELQGRLTELSGDKNSAVLTWAFQLVAQAQRQGEPVVWITSTETSFFPPDAHEMGIDVQALVVVRVPTPEDQTRTADYVLRSGSVGLVVLDFHPLPHRKAYRELPLQVQSRLAGLAKKHGTTVLCLTQKTLEAPSLGSLVSWQAHTRTQRVAAGFYGCAQVVKDKRRGAGDMYAQQVVPITGLY
jgi:hypothetical protein